MSRAHALTPLPGDDIMQAIVDRHSANRIGNGSIKETEGAPRFSEDAYGNPIEDSEYVDGRIIHCVFPDCGCDGAQHCMAENGAGWAACALNIEHGSLNSMEGRRERRIRLDAIERKEWMDYERSD